VNIPLDRIGSQLAKFKGKKKPFVGVLQEWQSRWTGESILEQKWFKIH